MYDIEFFKKVQRLINILIENYDAEHLGSILNQLQLTDIDITDIFNLNDYLLLKRFEDKFDLEDLEPEFQQALIDDFSDLLDEISDETLDDDIYNIGG